MSKIDKPVDRLVRKGEKEQISHIRNVRAHLTTYAADVKRIIKEL